MPTVINYAFCLSKKSEIYDRVGYSFQPKRLEQWVPLPRELKTIVQNQS